MSVELSNIRDDASLRKLEYLKSTIFLGLNNLNTGFDAPTIYYFSETDFKKVLDRVEKNKLGIYGIEPWLDNKFYDVLTYEDFDRTSTNPIWYRLAFIEFKKSSKKLMYAATYYVPDKLIPA